jgi:hypothetical protein
LPTMLGQSAVTSRLFFEGTISVGDISLVTDAREKQRIGIFGTDLSYAGSYGRVTSESIGRDINPLGRGAGQALIAGSINIGSISTVIPFAVIACQAGNSINNPTDSGSHKCRTCCNYPTALCPTNMNTTCDCDVLNETFYVRRCCGSNADLDFASCVERNCEYYECLPEKCTSPNEPHFNCPMVYDKVQMRRDCACDQNSEIFEGMDAKKAVVACMPNFTIGKSCGEADWWRVYTYRFLIQDALRNLLYCQGKSCLPRDIFECALNLCNGTLSIVFECDTGCHAKSAGFYKQSDRSITICWSNLLSIGETLGQITSHIIHEMIHYCDDYVKRLGHHKLQFDLCAAGKSENSLDDGFAVACTSACFGSSSGYTMPNTYMTDCCKCRVCSQ